MRSSTNVILLLVVQFFALALVPACTVGEERTTDCQCCDGFSPTVKGKNASCEAVCLSHGGEDKGMCADPDAGTDAGSDASED